MYGLAFGLLILANSAEVFLGLDEVNRPDLMSCLFVRLVLVNGLIYFLWAIGP